MYSRTDERHFKALGLPHSATHGSKDVCSSPWLFAAYHGLLRLIAPRHPPQTRIRLTILLQLLIHARLNSVSPTSGVLSENSIDVVNFLLLPSLSEPGRLAGQILACPRRQCRRSEAVKDLILTEPVVSILHGRHKGVLHTAPARRMSYVM